MIDHRYFLIYRSYVKQTRFSTTLTAICCMLVSGHFTILAFTELRLLPLFISLLSAIIGHFFVDFAIKAHLQVASINRLLRTQKNAPPPRLQPHYLVTTTDN